MKTTQLFAIGAVMLTVLSQSRAGDSVLSPRAQANQIKIVPGIEQKEMSCCRESTAGAVGAAAKAKALGAHSVVAGSSKDDPNLTQNASGRIGSPKGLQQLQENGRQYQVAPLK